MVELVALPG